MFDAYREKRRQKRVQKEIDRIGRAIMLRLKDLEYQPLDFGNLRKGDPWGVMQDGSMLWTYVVDIPVGKPIQYVISYSLKSAEYICFAKTARNNYSNVFQFSTPKVAELEARLTELAVHIPSLRERSLREYLYYEAKRAPRKKWYNPFGSVEKTREYLEEVVLGMLNDEKITKTEADRIGKYIANLT